MSGKTELDPTHDDSVKMEFDEISETVLDLWSVGTASQIQAANCDTAFEHHRSKSGFFGKRSQHETTDQNTKKRPKMFSSTEHQLDKHCITAEIPSKESQSNVFNSMRPSVIRHTNEYLHIPSPAENVNATLESISKTEDPAQASSSVYVGKHSPHTSEPLHYVCNVCNESFFFKNDFNRQRVLLQ